MRPEAAKFLQDMLDCAKAIEQFVAGKSDADFLSDRALRDAVQWNFCVIGEALARLKQFDEELAERITGHRKIVGFRNQLIHGYGVINNDITWNVIQTTSCRCFERNWKTC
jgi:uncharacterized protein with HEPN domain